MKKRNNIRGLIFSSDMALANLEGRKTETRRLIKEPVYTRIVPAGSSPRVSIPFPGEFIADDCRSIICPYGIPGDYLYQRERLYCDFNNGIWHYHTDKTPVIISDADAEAFEVWQENKTLPYVPSIHMPRFAARCWFKITEVKAERLQDITEESAWAEGCKRGEPTDNGGWFPAEETDPSGAESGWDCAEDWYADLWETLHGEGSWDKNPFVWVIKYERVEKPAL